MRGKYCKVVTPQGGVQVRGHADRVCGARRRLLRVPHALRRRRESVRIPQVHRRHTLSNVDTVGNANDLVPYQDADGGRDVEEEEVHVDDVGGTQRVRHQPRQNVHRQGHHQGYHFRTYNTPNYTASRYARSSILYRTLRMLPPLSKFT